MNLKEVGVNTRNWVDLTQLLESPCECGVETMSIISHS